METINYTDLQYSIKRNGLDYALSKYSLGFYTKSNPQLGAAILAYMNAATLIECLIEKGAEAEQPEDDGDY